MSKIKLSKRAEPDLIGMEVAVAHDMRDRIWELVDTLKTQDAAAQTLGISATYLSDVMLGRRGISPQLAARLGWRARVIYTRPVEAEHA